MCEIGNGEIWCGEHVAPILKISQNLACLSIGCESWLLFPMGLWLVAGISLRLLGTREPRVPRALNMTPGKKASDLQTPWHSLALFCCAKFCPFLSPFPVAQCAPAAMPTTGCTPGCPASPVWSEQAQNGLCWGLTSWAIVDPPATTSRPRIFVASIFGQGVHPEHWWRARGKGRGDFPRATGRNPDFERRLVACGSADLASTFVPAFGCAACVRATCSTHSVKKKKWKSTIMVCGAVIVKETSLAARLRCLAVSSEARDRLCCTAQAERRQQKFISRRPQNMVCALHARCCANLAHNILTSHLHTLIPFSVTSPCMYQHCAFTPSNPPPLAPQVAAEPCPQTYLNAMIA